MVFSERNKLTEQVCETLNRWGRDYDPAVVFNVITALEVLRCFEAFTHLEALFKTGYECEKGQLQDLHCFHCGEWLCEDRYRNKDAPDKHHPDCPYLAAKAFLESLTQTPPPRARSAGTPSPRPPSADRSAGTGAGSDT